MDDANQLLLYTPCAPFQSCQRGRCTAGGLGPTHPPAVLGSCMCSSAECKWAEWSGGANNNTPQPVTSLVSIRRKYDNISWRNEKTLLLEIILYWRSRTLWGVSVVEKDWMYAIFKSLLDHLLNNMWHERKFRLSNQRLDDLAEFLSFLRYAC